MKRFPIAVGLACATTTTLFGASAYSADKEPIEVIAKDHLSVRRGDRDTGPVKEGGIHPKTVSQKEKNPLDRFTLIRFDSNDFGKDVRAIELQLQAKDEKDTHGERYRFRVYGVKDGDKEDEAFTTKTYEPGAKGTLFDNSTNMLDRRQVSVLGSFTTEQGKEVHFSSSSLTSFVKADTNGIVTLVITRETEAPTNSVFEDRASEKPPKLRLVKNEE